MRRLFVPALSEAQSSVMIGGMDHHHLRNVLRLRRGDTLVLLDGNGQAFHAEIVEVHREATIARIVCPAPVPPDPPVEIWVAQAPGRGDRFEQVIQHGTEMGASGFIPLITERTGARYERAAIPGKLARWRQVARAASEQCGRARIPAIETPIPMAELLNKAAGTTLTVLLDAGGEALGSALSRHLPHQPGDCIPRVLLMVGPEGGFTPAEIAHARERGVHPASLGPYTLRTETAALAAIARIVHHLEGHHGMRAAGP